jgi:hypothetical protein
LGECGGGELLDGVREGDVAEGGGVGLAGAGEPAEEADESLPCGLAGLAGGDQDPAVAADRVGVRPGLVDDGEVFRVMAGLAAASAVIVAGVG